jgi:hypothetical protein
MLPDKKHGVQNAIFSTEMKQHCSPPCPKRLQTCSAQLALFKAFVNRQQLKRNMNLRQRNLYNTSNEGQDWHDRFNLSELAT